VGGSLICELLRRGHSVCSLARAGSDGRVPGGCDTLLANALDADTFADHMPEADVFVHLTGVAHPSPAKERQFREIDQVSLEQSVIAAKARCVPHFVYVSVAQPAPVMKVYGRVRAECEKAIADAGLNATILRPWYVLGPGHYWPYALLPFYWVLARMAVTREGAERLGLVTLAEMTGALAWSAENPVQGIRVLRVPDIRRHRVPSRS
jgi:uncharacterized protein YbjT (DUF2867 family)